MRLAGDSASTWDTRTPQCLLPPNLSPKRLSQQFPDLTPPSQPSKMILLKKGMQCLTFQIGQFLLSRFSSMTLCSMQLVHSRFALLFCISWLVIVNHISEACPCICLFFLPGKIYYLMLRSQQKSIEKLPHQIGAYSQFTCTPCLSNLYQLACLNWGVCIFAIVIVRFCSLTFLIPNRFRQKQGKLCGGYWDFLYSWEPRVYVNEARPPCDETGLWIKSSSRCKLLNNFTTQGFERAHRPVLLTQWKLKDLVRPIPETDVQVWIVCCMGEELEKQNISKVCDFSPHDHRIKEWLQKVRHGASSKACLLSLSLQILGDRNVWIGPGLLQAFLILFISS